MNYGIDTRPKHEVIMPGPFATHAQTRWTAGYESDGTFNYKSRWLPHNTDMMSTIWSFSKPEDAVLFALMFK